MHNLHEFAKSLEETKEDRGEKKEVTKKVHEPKPQKSFLTFHHLTFESFWLVSLDIGVFNEF